MLELFSTLFSDPFFWEGPFGAIWGLRRGSRGVPGGSREGPLEDPPQDKVSVLLVFRVKSGKKGEKMGKKCSYFYPKKMQEKTRKKTLFKVFGTFSFGL